MFLFFASRRRHTRLVSDWSSDVCSSDLAGYDAIDRGMFRDAVTFQIEQAGGAVRDHRETFPDRLRRSQLQDVGMQVCNAQQRAEIGRASCRERVESSVGEVGWRGEKYEW